MPRLHAMWSRDDQTQQLTKLTVFEARCMDSPRELRLERRGEMMLLTIHVCAAQPTIILLDKVGFESLCERAEEFRRQWSAESPGVPV